MRLYRKLPADERRKDKDSEYIFEHHTEKKVSQYTILLRIIESGDIRGLSSRL